MTKRTQSTAKVEESSNEFSDAQARASVRPAQTSPKIGGSTNGDEPTWENADARERAAIISAEKRILARPERVRVRVEKTPTGFKTVAAKGGVEATLPIQLADAMGTTSQSFSHATLSNLATFIDSCSHAGVNSTDLSAALAVMDGMKPENEVEAMLLAQMWATNESAMRALGMIGKSDWIDNAAMFGNLATKLLRTYVSQIETLAKLRRKGEQTVKVVHVYPGGQAVVADTFNSGGGYQSKNGEQSDGPDLSAALSPAMLGQDPQGFGVPISGGFGQTPLPDARRHESRPAEGQSERAQTWAQVGSNACDDR